MNKPATTSALESGTPVHRIVSASSAKPPATTGVSSAFAMGQAAGHAANPTRKHGHLPALRVEDFAVQADVPLPARRFLPGTTKYDALLDKLQADGQCVSGIPLAYKAALVKACETYLKHRPQLAAKSLLSVRTLADGSAIGIWRLSKAPGDKPAKGAKA